MLLLLLFPISTVAGDSGFASGALEHYGATEDAAFYARGVEVDEDPDLEIYVPFPEPGQNVYSRAEAYIGGEIAKSEGGRQNDRYRVGCNMYWYSDRSLADSCRVYDNLTVEIRTMRGCLSIRSREWYSPELSRHW